MMDDDEIRPLAIRAPWASQSVTSAQWVLETEIFGQIAEQFCGPPHSQMKSFQHFLSTRPQFKDKILQTDTRHYYDHLPMPQKFHPRHDWDEQFGLHKVTQLDSIGLIWEVSFVLSLFQPLFSLTFVFLDP